MILSGRNSNMNFFTFSIQFYSAQMATLSCVSQCSKCQTRIDGSKYVEGSCIFQCVVGVRVYCMNKVDAREI